MSLKRCKAAQGPRSGRNRIARGRARFWRDAPGRLPHINRKPRQGFHNLVSRKWESASDVFEGRMTMGHTFVSLLVDLGVINETP